MKSFDKLKAKLAELFQLDQADLDFGIYRTMNYECQAGGDYPLSNDSQPPV